MCFVLSCQARCFDVACASGGATLIICVFNHFFYIYIYNCFLLPDHAVAQFVKSLMIIVPICCWCAGGAVIHSVTPTIRGFSLVHRIRFQKYDVAISSNLTDQIFCGWLSGEKKAISNYFFFSLHSPLQWSSFFFVVFNTKMKIMRGKTKMTKHNTNNIVVECAQCGKIDTKRIAMSMHIGIPYLCSILVWMST